MQESEKPFLMVRLSSIGDIVHTLPAVASLGRAFPGREIHWVVEKSYDCLLEGNPYVQRRIQLDTLGWRRRLASGKTFMEVAHALLQLQDFEYEAVIDFQGLLKSALIARLARARTRIGFAEGWAREAVAAAFYNQPVYPRCRRHVIEMNLALVETLGARAGAWEFPLPRNEADDDIVEEKLAALGVSEFIIVNPGGGWKAKRWPPKNYSELIRKLEHEIPYEILLTGSPAEESLIEEILDGAGSARAHYFSSTLVQFSALAKRAKLFIGGDTGPLHLAAAAGTPIVAIYSSDPRNTPERNGPFNPADITLTNPNTSGFERHSKNADYVGGVSVERVLQAVSARMKGAHG
jgi:lipopolysaccharide heptosyltransferase I